MALRTPRRWPGPASAAPAPPGDPGDRPGSELDRSGPELNKFVKFPPHHLRTTLVEAVAGVVIDHDFELLKATQDR